jgi:hypothetical protein
MLAIGSENHDMMWYCLGNQIAACVREYQAPKKL